MLPSLSDVVFAVYVKVLLPYTFSSAWILVIFLVISVSFRIDQIWEKFTPTLFLEWVGNISIANLHIWRMSFRGIYCKFIDKKNPFGGCAGSNRNAISYKSKIQSDKDFSAATRNIFGLWVQISFKWLQIFRWLRSECNILQIQDSIWQRFFWCNKKYFWFVSANIF